MIFSYKLLVLILSPNLYKLQGLLERIQKTTDVQIKRISYHADD